MDSGALLSGPAAGAAEPNCQHLVARLRLKHVVGRGASATVALGTVAPASKGGQVEQVAAKLLHPSPPVPTHESEREEKMFRLEARRMVALQCPQIVECLGLCQLDGSVKGLPPDHQGNGGSLAMLLEFMEMGSLAKLVLKQMTNPNSKMYTDREALLLLLDVALGLQHMHGMTPRLVHRDLKLENLLLTKRNGRLQCKIADLGLHAVLDHTLHKTLLRRKQASAQAGSAAGAGGGIFYLGTYADAYSSDEEQRGLQDGDEEEEGEEGEEGEEEGEYEEEGESVVGEEEPPAAQATATAAKQAAAAPPPPAGAAPAPPPLPQQQAGVAPAAAAVAARAAAVAAAAAGLQVLTPNAPPEAPPGRAPPAPLPQPAAPRAAAVHPHLQQEELSFAVHAAAAGPAAGSVAWQPALAPLPAGAAPLPRSAGVERDADLAPSVWQRPDQDEVARQLSGTDTPAESLSQRPSQAPPLDGAPSLPQEPRSSVTAASGAQPAAAREGSAAPSSRRRFISSTNLSDASLGSGSSPAMGMPSMLGAWLAPPPPPPGPGSQGLLAAHPSQAASSRLSAPSGDRPSVGSQGDATTTAYLVAVSAAAVAAAEQSGGNAAPPPHSHFLKGLPPTAAPQPSPSPSLPPPPPHQQHQRVSSTGADVSSSAAAPSFDAPALSARASGGAPSDDGGGTRPQPVRHAGATFSFLGSAPDGPLGPAAAADAARGLPNGLTIASVAAATAAPLSGPHSAFAAAGFNKQPVNGTLAVVRAPAAAAPLLIRGQMEDSRPPTTRSLPSRLTNALEAYASGADEEEEQRQQEQRLATLLQPHHHPGGGPATQRVELLSEEMPSLAVFAAGGAPTPPPPPPHHHHRSSSAAALAALPEGSGASLLSPFMQGHASESASPHPPPLLPGGAPAAAAADLAVAGSAPAPLLNPSSFRFVDVPERSRSDAPGGPYPPPHHPHTHHHQGGGKGLQGSLESVEEQQHWLPRSRTTDDGGLLLGSSSTQMTAHIHSPTAASEAPPPLGASVPRGGMVPVPQFGSAPDGAAPHGMGLLASSLAGEEEDDGGGAAAAARRQQQQWLAGNNGGVGSPPLAYQQQQQRQYQPYQQYRSVSERAPPIPIGGAAGAQQQPLGGFPAFPNDTAAADGEWHQPRQQLQDDGSAAHPHGHLRSASAHVRHASSSKSPTPPGGAAAHGHSLSGATPRTTAGAARRTTSPAPPLTGSSSSRTAAAQQLPATNTGSSGASAAAAMVRASTSRRDATAAQQLRSNRLQREQALLAKAARRPLASFSPAASLMAPPPGGAAGRSLLPGTSTGGELRMRMSLQAPPAATASGGGGGGGAAAAAPAAGTKPQPQPAAAPPPADAAQQPQAGSANTSASGAAAGALTSSVGGVGAAAAAAAPSTTMVGKLFKRVSSGVSLFSTAKHPSQQQQAQQQRLPPTGEELSREQLQARLRALEPVRLLSLQEDKSVGKSQRAKEVLPAYIAPGSSTNTAAAAAPGDASPEPLQDAHPTSTASAGPLLQPRRASTEVAAALPATATAPAAVDVAALAAGGRAGSHAGMPSSATSTSVGSSHATTATTATTTSSSRKQQLEQLNEDRSFHPASAATAAKVGSAVVNAGEGGEGVVGTYDDAPGASPSAQQQQRDAGPASPPAAPTAATSVVSLLLAKWGHSKSLPRQLGPGSPASAAGHPALGSQSPMNSLEAAAAAAMASQGGVSTVSSSSVGHQAAAAAAAVVLSRHTLESQGSSGNVTSASVAHVAAALLLPPAGGSAGPAGGGDDDEEQLQREEEAPRYAAHHPTPVPAAAAAAACAQPGGDASAPPHPTAAAGAGSPAPQDLERLSPAMLFLPQPPADSTARSPPRHKQPPQPGATSTSTSTSGAPHAATAAASHPLSPSAQSSGNAAPSFTCEIEAAPVTSHSALSAPPAPLPGTASAATSDPPFPTSLPPPQLTHTTSSGSAPHAPPAPVRPAGSLGRLVGAAAAHPLARAGSGSSSSGKVHRLGSPPRSMSLDSHHRTPAAIAAAAAAPVPGRSTRFTTADVLQMSTSPQMRAAAALTPGRKPLGARMMAARLGAKQFFFSGFGGGASPPAAATPLLSPSSREGAPLGQPRGSGPAGAADAAAGGRPLAPRLSGDGLLSALFMRKPRSHTASPALSKHGGGGALPSPFLAASGGAAGKGGAAAAAAASGGITGSASAPGPLALDHCTSSDAHLLVNLGKESSVVVVVDGSGGGGDAPGGPRRAGGQEGGSGEGDAAAHAAHADRMKVARTRARRGSTGARGRRVLAAAKRALSPEFQWVFQLTGATGSSMYMAPEVHRNQPYNEAADVFSFGVVAYEVLSRTMLIFTHVGDGGAFVAQDSDMYADRVVEGYRPSKPPCVSDEAWQLISHCWHADPVERPSIQEVVLQLRVLLDQLPEGPPSRSAAGGGCCTIC